MKTVYVAGARRTAIGAFGGSLCDTEPAALGALVIKSALADAGIDAGLVGHIVMGQVIPIAPRDAYLARVAMMKAGIPQETRP